MKKIILIISLILFCTSCLFIHRGIRINGTCRPKYPNFTLLKTPFKETDKLIFNRVYTLNGENKEGIGFYADGRMILLSNYNYKIQNYDLISLDFIKSKNWNNPDIIGYWRVEGDKIKTEYFSCTNYGNYIIMQGEIKGDTILLLYERDYGFL